MSKRHLLKLIAITLMFVVMGGMLLVGMEPGTVLWQLLILIVITWLSVMVVLQLDFRHGRQQRVMDNKELLLDAMISSSPVVVWTFDRDGIITKFAGRALSASNFDVEGIEGKQVADIFSESPDLLREVERAYRGERFVSYQYLQGRYYRHHFQPAYSGNSLEVVHCVSVDLTREKELEEQLRLSSKIFSSTADAIVVTDERRLIQSVNGSFTEITGFTAEDVLGERFGLPRTASQDVSFYKKVWRDLKKRDSWRGEVWSKRKSGELFSGRMSLKVVRDDEGEISNFVAFFSDITDLKRSQEELRYLANHDALTGLPNRRLFLDRLDQAIKRAKRISERVAIYFIDLDEFKKINDTLGHHVGDGLLKEVGQRLQNVVRESDTVSRLAGDEFTIITETVTSQQEVRNIAKKVLGIFELPFTVHDREFYVSASVGIGVFPDDGDDMVSLMKGADSAMYRAKAEGRNGYYYLATPKDEIDRADLFFNSELRMALKRNQLSLAFQPQVHIQTGEVFACEALLRWNHHSRGQVMPRTFIPMAEQSGLIHELGAWVLEAACDAMVKWREMETSVKQVAVNVSVSQLQNSGFPDLVARVLAKTQLPPNCLILEFPEAGLLADLDTNRQALTALADLGVVLAIDDFGTGSSPYSYLKELPIGIVKIDQQVMKAIKLGNQNDSLARAIFGVGDVLGLNVVAEGVERSIQEKYLYSMGCHYAQGYLYGKPIGAEAFAQQLARSSTL